MKQLIALILLLSTSLAHAGAGDCRVWNDGVKPAERHARERVRDLRNLVQKAYPEMKRAELAALSEHQLVEKFNALSEPKIKEAIQALKSENIETKVGYHYKGDPGYTEPSWAEHFRNPKQAGQKRIWVDKYSAARYVEVDASGKNLRVSDPIASVRINEKTGEYAFFLPEKFDVKGRGGINVGERRTFIKTPLELTGENIRFQVDPRPDDMKMLTWTDEVKEKPAVIAAIKLVKKPAAALEAPPAPQKPVGPSLGKTFTSVEVSRMTLTPLTVTLLTSPAHTDASAPREFVKSLQRDEAFQKVKGDPKAVFNLIYNHENHDLNAKLPEHFPDDNDRKGVMAALGIGRSPVIGTHYDHFNVKTSRGEDIPVMLDQDSDGHRWVRMLKFKEQSDYTPTYKVYARISPADIKAVLPELLSLGKENNLEFFKIAATAKELRRNDKFIFYFKNSNDAVAFGNALNKLAAEKNLKQTPAPAFTAQYGKFVSFGEDSSEKSHRQKVVNALIDAVDGKVEIGEGLRNVGLAGDYTPVRIAEAIAEHEKKNGALASDLPPANSKERLLLDQEAVVTRLSEQLNLTAKDRALLRNILDHNEKLPPQYRMRPDEIEDTIKRSKEGCKI